MPILPSLPVRFVQQAVCPPKLNFAARYFFSGITIVYVVMAIYFRDDDKSRNSTTAFPLK